MTNSDRAQITSLLDAVAFPAAVFGALYHGRWRIEAAQGSLGSRGLSGQAANQNFAAKALFDRLNARAAYVVAYPHKRFAENISCFNACFCKAKSL